MLPFVVFVCLLVVVLIVAGRADGRTLAPPDESASLAALYRTQERWALDQDRRHGVGAEGAEQRPAERRVA